MRHIRPVGIAAAVACGLVLSVGAAGTPAAAGTVVLQPAVARAAPSALGAAGSPSAAAVAATPVSARATAPATGVRTAAAPAPVLRRGSKGAAVLAVQRRLITLGYWLGVANGTYGDNTVHAVTALQKAAGLSRDGVLGPDTRRALDAGVRPRATSRRTGTVVEVDLKRQVLLVVVKGKVTRILDVSTGSGERYTTASGGTARAVTPKGSYRVTRGINGWRKAPLGLLYRPKYFNGGIAVHGALSVPTYPASHGCVRVTLAAMDMLWKTKLLRNGTRVLVR